MPPRWPPVSYDNNSHSTGLILIEPSETVTLVSLRIKHDSSLSFIRLTLLNVIALNMAYAWIILNPRVSTPLEWTSKDKYTEISTTQSLVTGGVNLHTSTGFMPGADHTLNLVARKGSVLSLAMRPIDEDEQVLLVANLNWRYT
jgi:hypothetical protein